MPPQRVTFRHTASATLAVSEPGCPAVSSIATRTGTRSRTWRMALDAVDGSSTSSRPAGASARIEETASPTSHAPLASSRSYISAPAAARTAATRPASSPMPTLTFRQRKPDGAAAAACSAARPGPRPGSWR